MKETEQRKKKMNSLRLQIKEFEIFFIKFQSFISMTMSALIESDMSANKTEYENAHQK